MSQWSDMDIEQHVEGLSFVARAVYASAYSLTFHHQCEDVAIIAVRRVLGLSAAAWEDAYEELFAAGLMFTSNEPDHVCIMCASTMLSRAVGAPGRPKASTWAHLRDLAFELHEPVCVYCGATENLAVDHVIPVERGGSNHPANLVPACKPCNSAKGAKTWAEWWPISPAGRKFRAERLAAQ